MQGRATHIIIVAATLVVCAEAGVAHAQDWALSARTAVTGGASDNILNQPESTSAGMPDPVGDVFYQVRPSALAEYGSPRTRHRLTYVFDAFFYQENSEANSTSHHLEWRTRWLASPRSELSFAASGDTGQASTFLIQAEPESGAAELIPDGERTFVRAALTQGYEWLATRRLRLGQNFSVRTSRTTAAGEPQTEGNELTAGLTANQAWPRDTLGATLSVSVIDLHRFMTDGAPVGQSATELDITPTARWRRILSKRWIGTLQAGATVTTGPSPTVLDRARPVARMELSHERDWGGAALSLSRRVSPNLFVARRTVTDTAALRAWLPLPWLRRNPQRPTLVAASSVAAQSGRGFDIDTGDDEASWSTYLVDVGLTWAATEHMRLALRYYHFRQDGSAGMPESFRRNVVTLGVAGEIGSTRQVRHRRITEDPSGESQPGSFTDDD